MLRALRVRRYSSRPASPFLRGPLHELLAVALEGHPRHPEAARVGDPVHVHADHRAAARAVGEAGHQVVEPRGAGQHHLAAAVQAHDVRRALERAEHQADAAVVAQVGDRLRAAAGQVEVRHLVRAEHRERPGQPLRRHVHVALAARRRRADEEHRLRQHERRQALVDRACSLLTGRTPRRCGPAGRPGARAPRAAVQVVAQPGLVPGAARLGAGAVRRVLRPPSPQAAIARTGDEGGEDRDEA